MNEWRKQKPDSQCLECGGSDDQKAASPAPQVTPGQLREIAPNVWVTRCPTWNCGALIEKKAGCSSVRCIMCKNKFPFPKRNNSDEDWQVFVALEKFLLVAICIVATYMIFCEPTHQANVQAYVSRYGQLPSNVTAFQVELRHQVEQLQAQLKLLPVEESLLTKLLFGALLSVLVSLLLICLMMCGFSFLVFVGAHGHRFLPGCLLKTSFYRHWREVSDAE